MLKNVFKFSGVGALIVVLGLSILYGVQYLRQKYNPEYQAEQLVKGLEKQYAEDTYGGDTPEETLRLFIDALKKGDTDLAAKYFVLDKQGEWKKELAKIKEGGLLDVLLKDIERATKYRSSSENQIFFTGGNEKSEAVINIDLIKIVNKWKIRGI